MHPGCEYVLFTIVPTNNVKEFKNIPLQEKKKNCLYDGVIANGKPYVKGMMSPPDDYLVVLEMDISTRMSGVFVKDDDDYDYDSSIVTNEAALISKYYYDDPFI